MVAFGEAGDAVLTWEHVGLLPSIYKALSAADLAEQFEQIKITPSVMNTEELSKLWTAVQSSYRPTAAYMASVVLIEMPRPARSYLPHSRLRKYL